MIGRIQSGNANVTRNMLRCNKRWSSRPVLGEHRAGDDRLQSFGAIEGVVISERLRIYHLTRWRWAAERTEHPR
jgi:hypothetical protein